MGLGFVKKSLEVGSNPAIKFCKKQQTNKQNGKIGL